MNRPESTAGLLLSASLLGVMTLVTAPVVSAAKVYTEFPVVCARCHKPDGRGGPAYGGFASDLRQTTLDRTGIIDVIAKGIRARGMPEFETVMTKCEIEGIAKYVEERIRGVFLDANGNRIVPQGGGMVRSAPERE